MKLVKNAGRAWRWFSVQGAAILLAAPWAWAQIPPDVKAMIPAGAESWIVSAFGVALIVGRVIDQGESET